MGAIKVIFKDGNQFRSHYQRPCDSAGTSNCSGYERKTSQADVRDAGGCFPKGSQIQRTLARRLVASFALLGVDGVADCIDGAQNYSLAGVCIVSLGLIHKRRNAALAAAIVDDAVLHLCP